MFVCKMAFHIIRKIYKFLDHITTLTKEPTLPSNTRIQMHIICKSCIRISEDGEELGNCNSTKCCIKDLFSDGGEKTVGEIITYACKSHCNHNRRICKSRCAVRRSGITI